MHFDEVYHARTATEFLQFWRYGIPHDIYEYTHPHLAKYAMAGGLVAFGDNQVTSQGSLGAPVRDAAIELRWDDADTRLVLTAALWHDIGRTNDGEDPRHGAQSAARVLELGLPDAPATAAAPTPGGVPAPAPALTTAPALTSAEAHRAVRHERDLAAPGPERERETHPRPSAPVDRERSVRDLPTVAVRTVKDALAVERADSIDFGETIDDPGREEQLAGEEAAAAGDPDLEAARPPARIPDLGREELDSVLGELPAADGTEVAGADSVAGEKAVQRPGGGVSRAARVAQENSAATPPEDERRREARRSPAHDDRVVRRETRPWPGRLTPVGALQRGVGVGVGRDEEKYRSNTRAVAGVAVRAGGLSAAAAGEVAVRPLAAGVGGLMKGKFSISPKRNAFIRKMTSARFAR
jgi:hypothetical protein